MGKGNFNQRQCIKALKRIGFFISPNQRKGKHFKYLPPDEIIEKIKTDMNVPKFIMIPRGKELHVQDLILKELKTMGGDDLVRKFLDNL